MSKTQSLSPPLRAVLTVLLLALTSSLVHATPNPPERMTYQGFLTDATGEPLGNTDPGPQNYDVVFRIWDEQTGGTDALWAEQQTVTVDKGYFSVLLGEGAPLTGELNGNLSTLFTTDTASDRYVEMTVKGIGTGSPAADVTILPRLRLLTAPYAFLAQNATKLVSSEGGDLVTSGGGTVTVDGPIAATSFSGGAVTVTGTVTAPSFVGNGTIPIGGIIMWSGSINTIPAGWALCNGAAGTPDLRNRFIVGAGQSYSPGITGGASSVKLTTSELPAHSHSGWTRSGDGAHSHTGNSHSWADNDDNDSPAVYLRSSSYHGEPGGGAVGPTGSSHQHYFTSYNTGSSGYHENRPPYYALAFIMRVQ